MKYYIKERFDREERINTAGTKARSDAEEIASRRGYVPFEILPDKEPEPSDSLWAKWQQHLNIYRQWRNLAGQLHDGDRVLFQMPLMYNSIFLKRVLKKMRKKGVVSAAVIHDLEALRLHGRKRTSKRALKAFLKTEIEEKQILIRCDKVIVHNDRMKKFLIDEGMDGRKLIELEIFDYLTEEKEIGGRKKEKTVCIAGNLAPEKAGYIYSIGDSRVVYFLYGPGFTGVERENFRYMGCLSPKELPGKLAAAFGLIWDGAETETCSGIYGTYLCYNNPHKTSLYLAAGLPVIIWERAALAKFITENGVGVTVSSLEEIAEKIDALSEADYEDMLENTRKISKRIREGFYLTKALEQI